MGVTLEYPAGATPLDPDEAAALIPSHITTQGQLNEWELANFLEGQRWALSPRRLARAELLTADFMQKLHERMFGRTWKWAGTFRKTEKSIGVAPEQIAVRLRDLCEDPDRVPLVAPGRDRGTLPSPPGRHPSVSERERPSLPSDGRPAADQTGGGAVPLGRGRLGRGRRRPYALP